MRARTFWHAVAEEGPVTRIMTIIMLGAPATPGTAEGAPRFALARLVEIKQVPAAVAQRMWTPIRIRLQAAGVAAVEGLHRSLMPDRAAAWPEAPGKGLMGHEAVEVRVAAVAVAGQPATTPA